MSAAHNRNDMARQVIIMYKITRQRNSKANTAGWKTEQRRGGSSGSGTTNSYYNIHQFGWRCKSYKSINNLNISQLFHIKNNLFMGGNSFSPYHRKFKATHCIYNIILTQVHNIFFLCFIILKRKSTSYVISLDSMLPP